MLDNNMESPLHLEKKTLVIDSNIFPVCTTNKTEAGKMFHKKLIFVHHDGEKMNVVIVDPVSGEIVNQKS